MKTLAHQVMNVLLMGLLLSAPAVNAQSTTPESTDLQANTRSFEVGTYMGNNWTMNLMLAVHQPQGATITIRDANKEILLTRYLKKSPTVYHQKLKFDECKPGVYQVEISDGQQTIVRRVEVVTIPAIESQRYITYSLPTSL
ncbi:hypothetical protein [Spirosoma validum]|uniref:T9SS type A sorting domain-containing protein n=1 Tax=Spirosoma validum TaxID=2771355 RepID=A0A927B2P3_9BACT|nr:hypothetical protein [Spirosoma validum]MBD2754218.1 hypothetical protein [Spirosoma validum]